MTVKLRLQRWQCRNGACKRKTFVDQLPEIAAPRARRTTRAADLVYVFGHGVGGRPGERLMKRIGMPTSDDTIVRCLKRRTKARRAEANLRVVGVDDWAWRKGSTYGTIIVDLEQREVVDLLPDRSASVIADWLERQPSIEIISRDRCGSFAQGAREGAPQALQIADRFHILQNLREAVQAQLSRTAGSSARPLLPEDGDGDEAAISCSAWDKHRAPSIAASPGLRTGDRGKRLSIASARSVETGERSTTSCSRRGSTAARSPNGSGLTRFPSVTPRRRRRLRHGISKTIYLAAGQKVACAAGVCSKKLERAVTRGVFQILSGF